MPSAQITYNAGKSYRIGRQRFFQGVTETVDDPEIIERCKATKGFAVFEPTAEEKPKAKKRIMLRAAEADPPKKKVTKKAKKTSSRR